MWFLNVYTERDGCVFGSVLKKIWYMRDEVEICGWKDQILVVNRIVDVWIDQGKVVTEVRNYNINTSLQPIFIKY